jgi:DNA repair exonuclease SbcCD ATPase subunit
MHTIQEQQVQLESMNTILKQEIKQIKILEQQMKQLESKKISNQNQINLVLVDIANIDGNNKIDEDIKQNKEKRQKYETRVENTENKLSQNKTFYNLLNQYESTLLNNQSLQLDLEEQIQILSKFETYRQQIEENKPILEHISGLKAELSDFEEVLTLIEEQYTREQANIIKYTALLEQIKRDLQEGREMERRMRISELYRSALKQLPYILLSKIQPILEKKVNDLLSITTDFTVLFDMSDSKIDIYLDRSIYKDKSRNIIINNASGFERFMASLAIRMALLELSNLPKINFMAIDEGWSSFDTHNINNVSVILDYLTSKFDFVLTISHLIQIKEHCDIQLSLKKDDYGFSKIVY